MNARSALRSFVLAASVLVLSCQDQRSVVAPEPASAPVAFRLAADGRKTPMVDIVEIDVSTFRDSAYQPFDLRRFAWNDSLAALQVPLHTPLRFRLRGILRRQNRDVVAWTASQDDTLDDLSAEANVVTFTLLTQDTTAPSVLGGVVAAGTNLIVLDSASGRLELNLPAGDAAGSVSFPTTLAESLYVDGKAATPADGAWTLDLGLGSSTAIQLVGTNKAVAKWTLSVGSRDRLGLEFSLAVDNGASRTNRGDTSVFTLPYVVDSAPHLEITLDFPKDRPRTLTFNGKDLDTSRSSWSISLPAPEAGSAGFQSTLVSTDSLGNVATRPVLVLRSTEAAAPELSWYTPPAREPWGAHTARFVLKVVGGDSLRRPVFTSTGLATASCDSIPLLREGTSVLWQGSVPLLHMDSGSIVASVTNRLGTSWKLDPAAIRRFDPNGPDTLAPSLSRLSPTGTGWIRSGSVSTVTGRAIDERVGKVRVVAVHAGKTDSAAWNPADSTWSWNLDWTADGDSLITFTAIDSTGNRSAPVQVRLVRDTRLPTLVWSTGLGISGDTLITFPRNVAFSVMASDAFLRGVTALRDGTTDTVSLADIRGGQWFRLFEFPSGWSTWTFASIDSAGNRQERLLRVLAGDTTGPALTISVNNRASFRRVADTLVYILPYVLDSALVARVSIDSVGDRPSSLSWDGNPLSVEGPTSWTLPLEIPVAGPAGARTYAVSARDSVGNASFARVRLVRDTAARAPTLAWDPPPSDKPHGATLDTFQVLIVGGDSLNAPTFASEEFGASVGAAQRIATRADSTWWRGVVTLGQYDSGWIAASVTNRLGRSWKPSNAFIRRFDPLGADLAPPKFTSATLPNNGWTRSNSVSLGGSASDARSNPVQVWVKRATGDSAAASWSAADSSWSFQVALPADVDTTITAYAVDAVGNPSAPAVLRIRRDTRKPGFSWATAPAVSGDTLRTNDPVQTISVNASAADLRRTWAVRSSTTDTLTFASAVAGIWSTDAPLPQGWSTWTVGATDSAGNDSVRVLRVLRDTIAPTVAWSVSGTNAEGKYAIAPARDTLWISSDTSITLALSSTTGFAGVAVPAPSVDSAGTALGMRSDLTLKPLAGTATTWTLTATDELGNQSRVVKIVVVGLTPVTVPTVKFGNSASLAGALEILPWPKTAHMTCQTGTTINIGTNAARDSVIWTETNLRLACIGPKVRSSTVSYTWTLRDTAYADTVFKTPTSDTSIALLIDAQDRNWVLSQNGGFKSVYRFARDSSKWIVSSQNPTPGDEFTSITTASDKANNRGYFVLRSASTNWYSPDNGPNGSFYGRVPAIAFRGDSTIIGVECHSGNACVTGSTTDGTISADTIMDGASGSSFGEVHALKDYSLQLFLRNDKMSGKDNYVIFRKGASNLDPVDFLSTEISGPLSGTTLASSTADNVFFAVGKGSDNNLWIRKYSDPTSSGVVLNAFTLPVSVPAYKRIHATRGKNCLWINIEGQGVYRIADDLSSFVSWPMTGSLGKPQVDSWGGAWLLLKASPDYATIHFKGIGQ